MSVPVSTKTSRKPNLDLEDGIKYPSSDGKPMGETGTHARVALMNIYGVLDRYFMNNPRVAVNANMFIYYVQGDYSGPQKVDHSGYLHLLRLFPSQPP